MTDDPAAIRNTYVDHFADPKAFEALDTLKRALYGTRDGRDALIESLAGAIHLDRILEERTVSLCDIGAGTGERTFALLDELHALARRTHRPGFAIRSIYAIEPSPMAAERIRERSRQSPFWSNLTVMTDTFPHVRPKTPCDLIVGIHSLYGFDRSAVKALADEVRRGNAHAYIVANNETSVLGQLKRVIDGTRKQRMEVNTFTSCLSDLGVPYSVEHFAYQWEVSGSMRVEVADAISTVLAIGKTLSRAKRTGIERILAEHTGYGFGWTEREVLVRVGPQ